MSDHGFAYLFERFPSFVQTFCHREALEMLRQGMNPLILSVRQPEDPPELAAAAAAPVTYLPPEKELRAEVDRQLDARLLPRQVRRAIKRQRAERDSQRIFEAAWLAPLLREKNIRHVHAHFGGLATRTAWWLHELYGMEYSFTGHANDIFCESGTPLSNAALARDARFIVCETDFARAWMEKTHPCARGRIFRVYNGIELGGFPERLTVSLPPLLLSIGRCVEKKGYADLIEACRILRDRGVEFSCQIVGEGPLFDALSQQIARSGLAASVKMAGARSQEEVRALLASAAVFVLACVTESGGGSDNLPTVIVEAMAAGAPVISTPVAGVPEMISSGQDGLLVEPHQPEQLASAIDHLLAHPAEAKILAERGRLTARERFDLTKTTRELKHLLVRMGDVSAPAPAKEIDPELPKFALRGSWGERFRRLFS